MEDHLLVLDAIEFAHQAHEGQVRKYTGVPYILHPLEVMLLLAPYTSTNRPPILAAAVLHDVLEDTDAEEEYMRIRFGDEVVDLVLEVTDVAKPEDGNRAFRKAMERAHIANASPAGQSIKVADMINNRATITQHDPGFAKVYLEEMRLTLEVATKAAPFLLRQAAILLKVK